MVSWFRLAGLLTGLAISAAVAAGGQVTVYKSPYCGCCAKWVEHMEQAGFSVQSQNVEDLSRVKAHFGVPPDMASCHTAIVEDKYIVEGHVPAGLVQRMLDEGGIRALAVPGMPVGSPGMEGPNPTTYDVIAVDEAGNASVYERVRGKSSSVPLR